MSKNGHFSKNNSNFQKKLKSALENRVRNTHTKFHRGRTKLKTQKVRGTEAFGREERKKKKKSKFGSFWQISKYQNSDVNSNFEQRLTAFPYFDHGLSNEPKTKPI